MIGNRPHSSAFSSLVDFERQEAAVIHADHDAAISEAYSAGLARGSSDARAEAEADAELRLAEAAALMEARLEEQRARLHEDCVRELNTKFDSAMKVIERSLEDRVSALLRPWLLEGVHERAMGQFAGAILRAAGGATKIHIEAPADLVEKLKTQLAHSPFAIGFSESDSADIRAYVDDTELDMNIASWIAELERATG